MKRRIATLLLALWIAACGTPLPNSSAAQSGSTASASPVQSPEMTSETSSASASAAPLPTPRSIPTPAPTVAPNPKPIVLPAGSIAITVSDHLVVRSKPRVSDDSTIYRPYLPTGTRLLVLAGPVAASGYRWYRVALISFALKGGKTTGWVAAADHDGTRWIGRSRNPAPTTLASGWGTAVIDSDLSPREWGSAARIDFEALLPRIDGGARAPASIFVMNDASNLYLAASLAGIPGCTYNPTFEFDNDNDGVGSELEDDWLAVHLPASAHGSVELLDDFMFPVGNVGPDTFAGSDYPPAGTIDGEAAGSHPGGTTTWVEMSHPLDSADDDHDFSLQPGDGVGLGFDAHTLGTGCGNCEPAASCNGSAFLPTPGSVVELVLAVPPR